MQIINYKYHHLALVQAALIINIVLDLYGLDKISNIYGNAHILSKQVRNAQNFTA